MCMCVLSGSDWVFLRKRTAAFSFSSFRMSRPRLDWIWVGTRWVVTPPRWGLEGGGAFFLRVAHQPFPAPAPALSWPHPSGLQARLPPPASSSSTLSLQEFRVRSTRRRSTSGGTSLCPSLYTVTVSSQRDLVKL